ncbi:MAG: UbiX family flavin prenyltransferase [Rhizobiales bacterium]|nr:UbiX family flavin prenyltransferase [Hyphomicrobiales bacterium]MBN9009603.1 UbiX family flavin prenyltransferase [Hyphomicrobiales bacterium]
MTGGAPRRVIVGISGASGIVLAIRVLEELRRQAVETHLVVSKAGERTLQLETDTGLDKVKALASVFHPVRDIGATIASGSFRTDGMIVIPCSVRTLAEIATGVTTTLLTRAADVTLKERRRLVLVVREAPLHLGHIRNMAAVTEMGAVVFPPSPAFYLKPEKVEDIVENIAGRALDLLGFPSDIARWQGAG